MRQLQRQAVKKKSSYLNKRGLLGAYIPGLRLVSVPGTQKVRGVVVMGHRKSIIKQTIDQLQGMAAYGQSKHQDKLANGGKPSVEKIYSYSTMSNYMDVATQFAAWARATYGCRTVSEARQYTGEYLQQRMDRGLSAWTVRRDAAALGKLYQCQTTDLGVQLPTRHRAAVTQHRGDKSAGHFSESRHQDLVDLCRATGLRRHEVAALRPSDVIKDPQGRVIVTVQQGKGGKYRQVVALDDRPYQIAQAAAADGRDRVIEHIPKYAPVHTYRAQFAQEMYRQIARDTATLPRQEVYCCRSDRAGTHYDKAAMGAVSAALGHSRLDVVTNYLK